MGNAQSDSVDSVLSKIQQRGGVPRSDSIENEYVSVILYAYQKPKESSDFLNDIQKRFFTSQCKFRWSWSEERPQSEFSSLLSISRAASSASAANEAYKKVVEGISKNPQRYSSILNDLRIRYFDPQFNCSFRIVNSPNEYMNDFVHVFR